MKVPSLKDLASSGMDQRRTIASSGSKLKGFTKNHGATRMRNASKIYASIKRSK